MAKRELQCHGGRTGETQRGVCKTGRKGRKSGVYGGQYEEREEADGGGRKRRGQWSLVGEGARWMNEESGFQDEGRPR